MSEDQDRKDKMEKDEFDEFMEKWFRGTILEVRGLFVRKPEISQGNIFYIISAIFILSGSLTAYTVGYLSNIPFTFLQIIDTHTAGNLIFNFLFLFSSSIAGSILIIYFFESILNYRSNLLIVIYLMKQNPKLKPLAKRLQKSPRYMIQVFVFSASQIYFLYNLLGFFYMIYFVIYFVTCAIIILLPEAIYILIRSFSERMHDEMNKEISLGNEVSLSDKRIMKFIKHIVSIDRKYDKDMMLRQLPRIAALIMISAFFLGSLKGDSVLSSVGDNFIIVEDARYEGIVYAMNSSGIIYAYNQVNDRSSTENYDFIYLSNESVGAIKLK